MMKLIFPAFLAVSFFCNAQAAKNVENQFAINIVLPGLVYETAVGNEETVVAELAFTFAIRDSDFFGSGYGIYPVGRFQYRDYYNFERRLRKNKRIEGNTGNYIAPTIVVQSGNAIFGNLELDSTYYLAAGVVYGLQRTAPKGFQFRLEGGQLM